MKDAAIGQSSHQNMAAIWKDGILHSTTTARKPVSINNSGKSNIGANTTSNNTCIVYAQGQSQNFPVGRMAGDHEILADWHSSTFCEIEFEMSYDLKHTSNDQIYTSTFY